MAKISSTPTIVLLLLHICTVCTIVIRDSFGKAEDLVKAEEIRNDLQSHLADNTAFADDMQNDWQSNLADNTAFADDIQNNWHRHQVEYSVKPTESIMIKGSIFEEGTLTNQAIVEEETLQNNLPITWPKLDYIKSNRNLSFRGDTKNGYLNKDKGDKIILDKDDEALHSLVNNDIDTMTESDSLYLQLLLPWLLRKYEIYRNKTNKQTNTEKGFLNESSKKTIVDGEMSVDIIPLPQTGERLETQPQKVYRASVCYSTDGKAKLQLQCPVHHTITTTLAYTAISAQSQCGYQPWDCILQEGVTQRCDGRTQCSILAVYAENPGARLHCVTSVNNTQTFSTSTHEGVGYQGNTRGWRSKVLFDKATIGHQDVKESNYIYFQVEYLCIKDERISVKTSSTVTPTITLNLEDIFKMNDTKTNDFIDPTFVVDDKTALLGIVGGSTLALVLLIAIVTSCIYRAKTRTAGDYGNNAGGVSAISSLCSEAVLTDPELIRQPRRHFQYDYRRQSDRNQPFGRGYTVWNGRSTTYTENELD